MSQRSVNNPRTTKKGENVTGASKRSVARAKPSTVAGSSVRKATKNAKAPADMTKEERKAQRRAEREERAVVAEVSDILLKRNETYTSRRRIWWILMGVGFVAAAAAWGILYLPGARDSVNTTSIAAIILLVIAYACIIGGFVFDIIKVGPLRTEAEKQVKAMSERRRTQVLEAAGKAEKDAKSVDKADDKADAKDDGKAGK